MSSDPPDTNAYFFAYKTAVYDNLFVGIVYGRQSLPIPFLPLRAHELSVYHHRHLRHHLCCISPHPSVRYKPGF
jgi:hypothetical protein